MSTAVTHSHCIASTPNTGMEPTRSQIRNAQRRHTAACLKTGIRIAKERRHLYESMVQLLHSGEAAVVLESLAIHRHDCQQLEHNVHFAAEANYLAYSAGRKTACSHSQHKRIHRTANLVKHEHGKFLPCSQHLLPPPPPPPPPALPSDPLPITCEAFEKELLATARVQYIVVEVPPVHSRSEPPASSVYSGAEPPAYNETSSPSLIDEVSMVFSLGVLDVSETSSTQEGRFREENQPDIVSLMRERCLHRESQVQAVQQESFLHPLDEQEQASLESALHLATPCGFCTGASCVFCSSPVMVPIEPLEGLKAPECTQQ